MLLATDYPFEQMRLGIDFMKELPISDEERTQVSLKAAPAVWAS